jgi:hypothetical protein
MSCRVAAVALIAVCMLSAAVRVSAIPGSIALLLPTGAIDAAAHDRLESGAPWVDTVPARQRDLAIYGVVRTTAGGDRLIDWARQAEPMQSTSYVQVGGRFSAPPALSDLDALVLDTKDIDDLRRCRPASCGMKLSGAEIVQVRAAIAAAGKNWKPAAQTAFRALLLARAHAYLAAGDAEMPPYDDHRTPVSLADEFASILPHLALDKVYGDEFGEYLRLYPRSPIAQVESFLSWSKETIGGGKPIVSITHVNIVRSSAEGRPEALVAVKQVYASHYLTASLSFTAISDASDGASRYLVYARRSRADVLTGPFAGLIRRTVERRIRSEGPALLDRLRRRLEREPMDGS